MVITSTNSKSSLYTLCYTGRVWCNIWICDISWLVLLCWWSRIIRQCIQMLRKRQFSV